MPQNSLQPNVSITHSVALQFKSTTLIAPPIVFISVAQPSTEAPTLAFRPIIVLPKSASELMFNTLDDYYYTPEATSMLIGPPKFLTKKFDMIEEQDKMARKIKNVEKTMENSVGLTNCEYVTCKDWGMSTSVNLPPNFKVLEFEEHDRYEDSIKYLGRYYNQLREIEGKKKENVAIVVSGPQRGLRGSTQQYRQPRP